LSFVRSILNKSRVWSL